MAPATRRCVLADGWASVQARDIFPLVLRERQIRVDGGLADNAAVSQAVALGVYRVFLLPTGYACAHRAAGTPHQRGTAGVRPADPAAAHQRRGLLRRPRRADRAAATEPSRCLARRLQPGARSHRKSRSTAGSWLDGGNPALRHPERLRSLHNHSTNTGAPPDAGCLHEPTEMDAPRVFEGGQRDGFIGRISSSRSRPGWECLPAVTTCLGEGISINITLNFSLACVGG